VTGDSVDSLQVANLVTPLKQPKIINGLKVDMIRFAEAAEQLGADKHDVLSIGGFRNAKGEFVPDYDSVRVERRNGDS